MVAYDSAYPEKQTTTSVTIRVLRNQNGPTFIPSSTYKASILEETPIGQEILTVQAQDLDANVSCPATDLNIHSYHIWNTYCH